MYVERYFPVVEVHVSTLEEASGTYDATMFVKSIVYHWWIRGLRRTNFGKLLVDIVDRYSFVGNKVPTYYEVIVQNKAQASLYPHHTTHIITHWYNSYPEDVGNPMTLPTIESVSTLHVATVWDPEPFQAGCMSIESMRDVEYTCIEEKFDIGTWYKKYLTADSGDVRSILNDPNTGPGLLYQMLFRQYHVLVIYAKSGEKLKYGNVQRIVSQMRSGVPVLLENRGEAFHEFITTYNYSCTFHSNDRAFQDAIERMKSPKLRQTCRDQAAALVGEFLYMHLILV